MKKNQSKFVKSGQTDISRKQAKPLENQGSQGVSVWQGKKDSNPQQRFWRPTCYHYTIALRADNEGIISDPVIFVKQIAKKLLSRLQKTAQTSKASAHSPSFVEVLSFLGHEGNVKRFSYSVQRDSCSPILPASVSARSSR